MSAATLLVLIASVIAVVAIVGSVLIWVAHPIETPVASCGTLRSPANPIVLVGAQPSGAGLLEGDLEAALAPGHCEQAHAQVRYSQQLALAAGGMASATAIGALVVGRRERRQLEADAAAYVERRRAGSGGLSGHGLPNRPGVRVEGPGAQDWERLRSAPGHGGAHGRVE